MTSGLPVELQCPQCGGPVTLEETDRIFSCGFCRVRLCMSFRGPATYCLTTPSLPPQGLLFVPYWRYRGMAFSTQGLEIQHRVADASLLAVEACGLPPSLGFRAQVLKLKPPAPDAPHRFLSPHYSLEQARMRGIGTPPATGLEAVEERQPKRPFEALVGETVALVYTPVSTEGGEVLDAILRRPYAGTDSRHLDRLRQMPSPGSTIRFSPMLCPQCGWDLAGEKDTLVPVCRNCHTLWSAESEHLARLPYGVPENTTGGDVFLPFWTIRATSKPIQVETLGDLFRVANVPRVLPDTSREQPFEYFIPAFKVHPQLFLRLARTLTLAQLNAPVATQIPSRPLHPVTLPPVEAHETLPVLFGVLAVPKKTYLPMLPSLRFHPTSTRLAYVPFAVQGGELIQPDTGTSLSRNALEMGRLI